MSGARHWEQDKEATVYVGNIDERVTDSLVWELMLQAGRIVNVHLPKDRVTQSHQGYGFVEFISEEDAEYAARVMNQVRLYGKPIRVNKASADKQKPLDVGANLFLGNLSPHLDEHSLYDTFSRFGPLLAPPKIARDPTTALSKGYAFLSYASFDAADDAVANMHGQTLLDRAISVQYAYKKDGKGERHGDPAERILAAQAKAHGVLPEAPPAQAMMGMPPSAPPALAPQQQQQQHFDPQQQQQMMHHAPPPHHDPYARGPPQGFPPPPQRVNAPLPPPPSGLPQRPPPSQAGYGGPEGFGGPPPGAPPPGFGGQGGMPPGFAAPPGAPPPGFGGPPGAPPPGFGAPPGMPQGFRR
ncbi:hypothetical protein V501_08135 [Pseudogymnoascus sp. VKM F-4519 (FW-2642)]|nr:hypothetical protein V501_08135 [Pseudogymnoascus sp. VKM F-4519 (FW-2642)]